MSKIITGLVVVILSSAGPVTATRWTLNSCAQDGPEAEGRAEFVESVQKAQPDTPHYTPNPFPKTKDEVFANVLDYYATAYAKTPRSELPEEQRRLFDAVAAGRVRYEVIEVENWTASRCHGATIDNPYSVLRIYDRDSGEEFMRAAVDSIGHFMEAQIRADNKSRPFLPFMSLVAAKDVLASVAGAPTRDPQYIAAWGMISCDVLWPCVAVREGESSILLSTYDGAVYRVEKDSTRLSTADELSPYRRGTTTRQVADEGRYLVSVGADNYVAAERIRGPRQQDSSRPK